MKSHLDPVSLILTGCATESAVLVNSSGRTTQCNNQGWGWLGAPIAVHHQHECLDKAKAAGYREGAARGDDRKHSGRSAES